MEKIICNGVDVSECVFLNMSKECRAIDNKMCKDCENCHYKSLARLNNQYEKLIEQNRELQTELVPFRAACFRGLSMATIAELAKSKMIGAEK